MANGQTNGNNIVSKIDRTTLVPIGVVLAFLIATLTAGWTAASAFTRLQTSVEMLKIEVRELKEPRPWTTRSMEIWAETLQKLNPDLKLPPVH